MTFPLCFQLGWLDFTVLASCGFGICDSDSHDGSGSHQKALGPKLPGRGFDVAAAVAMDVNQGWLFWWGGGGREMGLIEGMMANIICHAPLPASLACGEEAAQNMFLLCQEEKEDRGRGWGE